MLRIFILCLLALSTSACATVVRGTQDKMAISTIPPGAVVTTDQETKESLKARKKSSDLPAQFYGCPATPCEFKVPRKSEFILTLSKEGFEAVEIGIDNGIHKESMKANLAGSVSTGAVMGLGVGTIGSALGASSASAVGAGLGATAIVALPVAGASVLIDSSTGALYNLRPNPITITLPPEGTEFEPHPKVKLIREKRRQLAEEAARKRS
jgi:hypothetical protein